MVAMNGDEFTSHRGPTIGAKHLLPKLHSESDLLRMKRADIPR
jgi:hypothetical protein